MADGGHGRVHRGRIGAPAGRISRLASRWLLAASFACSAFPAAGAAAADEPPGAATAPAAATASSVRPRTARPASPARGATLDERVALLAKELDLDAGQQSAVRRLLEHQREQVRQVWSNTAIAAASRVGATQAISERTADEIRALLNDEQKKKYLAARQPRTPADQPAKPGLDYWLDAAKH